jgi:hypothetical protein
MAGVFGKVTSIVELEGIDKNAHHYPSALFLCLADQVEMSLMQGTHGWHKTNGFACLFPLGNLLFQKIFLGYDFHRIQFRIQPVKVRNIHGFYLPIPAISKGNAMLFIEFCLKFV